ncbi:hypothetical protein OKW76_05265 [Sphingomonas sp. S1-29]|uniref:DUF6961 family protein n=1 Tax=Sphingomonas sp. S1-29 TaxID=2991074 RepID=UPI00223F867B|nr:hypothetical protein [Sphingomonas sp. S1-29]UZK70455.1 hypothetical protein OKW76_05265 [Sphingomonas sp. S1-29]
MTPEVERWAEALHVERVHGTKAPTVIAEQMSALALAGDEAGVRRWKAIAERYDQLQTGRPQ